MPLDDARLLAPVIPRSKVIGIGRNYAEHAAELGNEVPEEPLVFLKPNTSVVGPATRSSCRRGRSASTTRASSRSSSAGSAGTSRSERVGEVVLGTPARTTSRPATWQQGDGQWWRAKGSDSFCPLGPYLVTGIDPSDLRLTTRLDGETVQDGRTSQMVVDVPSLVAFVTSAMTLLPGDVILTGTPAGVGPMRPGSRVEVEVEGIGVLHNTAVRR